MECKLLVTAMRANVSSVLTDTITALVTSVFDEVRNGSWNNAKDHHSLRQTNVNSVYLNWQKFFTLIGVHTTKIDDAEITPFVSWKNVGERHSVSLSVKIIQYCYEVSIKRFPHLGRVGYLFSRNYPEIYTLILRYFKLYVKYLLFSFVAYYHGPFNVPETERKRKYYYRIQFHVLCTNYTLVPNTFLHSDYYHSVHDFSLNICITNFPISPPVWSSCSLVYDGNRFSVKNEGPGCCNSSKWANNHETKTARNARDIRSRARLARLLIFFPLCRVNYANSRSQYGIKSHRLSFANTTQQASERAHEKPKGELVGKITFLAARRANRPANLFRRFPFLQRGIPRIREHREPRVHRF